MKRHLIIWTMLAAASLQAAEFHVAATGNDANTGTRANPLKTISAAARVAQPGDEIIVHEGIYRERINPPRGGTSADRRITYRAADGENVILKGSEVVTGWKKVEGNVWNVVIPNSFFGSFNPFADLISGSWFHSKGRKHHTGAVYIQGSSLTEAANKKQLFQSGPMINKGAGYLFNVLWMRPIGSGQASVPGNAAVSIHGAKKTPTKDGNTCLGYIRDGNRATYSIDFGDHAEHMEFQTASALPGGLIEVRLDSPQGKLLGTCPVSGTGGWETWRTVKVPIEPTSGQQTVCLIFKAPQTEIHGMQLWYAEVDARNTTLWAQFKDVDPNKEETEVNARQTVFYPEQPGINYITVKGFTLEHAATPWAPPNAEQVGLIGTHWSKGWTIEDNTIRHSMCVGVTLGKYGDEFDNITDTADGYNGTIQRALDEGGWSKETIGSHIVRNNTIHDCGAAGICGSLGGAFSEITGNHIYNIHKDKLFGGFEQAAIKIHAPIDSLIANNCIHDASRGIWLDWMTQGTRVSGNLCYRNLKHDLFLEVNHGPFLIDNNLLLSSTSLTEWSEGGAYAHNLFAGLIGTNPEKRNTPYHQPHSTELAGTSTIVGGDNRYHNNILAHTGLDIYNASRPPMQVNGNMYLNTAKPFAKETDPFHEPAFNPEIRLIEENEAVYLEMSLPNAPQGRLVTSEQLGKTRASAARFETPEGRPFLIDTDYFGTPRGKHSAAGPVSNPGTGSIKLKVWPKN